MRLKYKLPLVSILLSIAVFAALWITTQNEMLRFLTDYQYKLSISNIDKGTSDIQYDINYGKRQLESIIRKIKDDELVWEDVSHYFYNEVEDSVFDKIGLVYSNKTYNITGTTELGDLADREYLVHVFDGKTIVSDPVPSKSTGEYQIVISYPIIISEKVIGAVVGTIPTANLEEKISTLNIDGNGYGFLINKKGKIIVHPRSSEISYENFFEHMGIDYFHSSNGYIPYTSFEGKQKYAFYQEIHGTELFAVIAIERADLQKPIMDLFSENLIIFAIVLILVIFISNYAIGSTLRQVIRMVKGMEKVEEGDYTLQIPVDSEDEIGDIAIQFNKTIEAISYRDEELQAVNQELAASFEEINDSSDKLMKAYDEISRRLQNEQLINTLSEVLYSQKDLDGLLKAILMHTEEIINADRCAVYFYDEAEDCFTLRESVNFSSEDKNVVFKKDEGTIGWIVKNKKELILNNAKDSRFVPKYAWSKDVAMALQIPFFNEDDEVIGVLSYLGKDLNLNFKPYVKQLSKMISVTVQNTQLIAEVKNTYFEIIMALIKAIELKDSYTRGHSERVMKYSLQLGTKLNLTKKDLETLRHGSILHDIGKLGIPDYILLKPDKLDTEEYNEIKKHPEKGEDFIKNLKFLEESLAIIRSHHERFDGDGYPDGLDGEEISLLAKIVTIADAYDAMTTKRAYKEELNTEEAIKELKRHKGTQFDPYLVEQFISIIYLNLKL